MSKIAIREMRESDLNFVIKGWLMSYWKHMMGYHPLEGIYFKKHQVWVKKNLQEGLCYVAHHADDEDQLLGFCAIGPDVLHYIHVKHVFQGLGVARALLKHCKFDSAPKLASHWTDEMFKFRKSYHFRYNPYAFFRGENDD